MFSFTTATPLLGYSPYDFVQGLCSRQQQTRPECVRKLKDMRRRRCLKSAEFSKSHDWGGVLLLATAYSHGNHVLTAQCTRLSNRNYYFERTLNALLEISIENWCQGAQQQFEMLSNPNTCRAMPYRRDEASQCTNRCKQRQGRCTNLRCGLVPRWRDGPRLTS